MDASGFADNSPGCFSHEAKQWYIATSGGPLLLIWKYNFHFVMDALQEALHEWEDKGCRGMKPHLVMKTWIPNR